MSSFEGRNETVVPKLKVEVEWAISYHLHQVQVSHYCGYGENYKTGEKDKNGKNY